MQTVILTVLISLPGLILVSSGFYLSLRVLKFPDLTCDASFAAGMVGFAVGLTTFDSSIIGVVLAAVFGGFAGALTGLMYSSYPTGVFKILASVLVMFGFYSINFRLLNQKNDQGFFNTSYFFNRLRDSEAAASPYRPLTFIVAATATVLIIGVVLLFLWSSAGTRIRVAGHAPELLTVSGINFRRYTLLGLVLSNAVIAVGGWLQAGITATVDIVQRGVVIDAIAALLLGEVLIDMSGRFRDRRISPITGLSGVAIGAVAYVAVRSLATFVLKDELKVFIQADRYSLIGIIIFLTVLASRSRSISFFDANDGEAL